MKELIKTLLREGLEKKIVLKSKSDKGNRYFEMLKTAKFQHYDSPKGQLSTFNKGEEDRKRLVTKLSNEDKKTYRAWLKTPEGQESIKKFEEYCNYCSDDDKIEERFVVDKYGDKLKTDKAWSGFNFTVPEYKTKVKDSLVDILVNIRGISEKSFNEYDSVIDEVKELFLGDNSLVEIVNDGEKNNKRVEYIAEKIYDYICSKQNNITEGKRKSSLEVLKDNKVPLTDEERKTVMDADAVWHMGPNGKPSPAVWKSKNKKTGKITYVTNTHRAYNTAPTLKGAITRFHDFIKGTA